MLRRAIPRPAQWPAAAFEVAQHLTATATARGTTARLAQQVTLTLSVLQALAWPVPCALRHHVPGLVWAELGPGAAASGLEPLSVLCALRPNKHKKPRPRASGAQAAHAAAGDERTPAVKHDDEGPPATSCAAGGDMRGDAQMPGPTATSARHPHPCASLLTPDKMRARLVDKRGCWRNDVEWASIERELKSAVATCADLVEKVEALAVYAMKKELLDFMTAYTDIFVRAAFQPTDIFVRVAFQPTMGGKQAYLLHCAKAVAKAVAAGGGVSIARVVVHDGRHFVSSSNADSEIERRAIHIDDALARLPVVDEANRPVDALPVPHVVTMLSGESGSGKTMALLTCVAEAEVGVYVSATDVWEEEKGLRFISADERSTAVRTTLCKLIAQRLLCVAPRLAEFEGPLSLTVAIDEAGSLPGFVRELCACLGSLDGELERQLWLRSCSLSVAVVVAGTGVDMLAAAPERLPGAFRMLRMAMDTDAMLQHLLTHLRRLTPQLPPDIALTDAPDELRLSSERLARAVERNAAAVQLCRNPRFAAALHRAAELKFSLDEEWVTIGFEDMQLSTNPHLQATMHDLAEKKFDGLSSDGAADAFVRLLITAAALRYKSLGKGGLVHARSVHRWRKAALKCAFSGAPAGFSDGHVALVRSFGVVTDRARWIPTDSLPRTDDTGNKLLELAKDSTHTLVSPASRFVMSCAQRLLFQMDYGLRALADSAWMGCENSVAEYLAEVLLGCHGRTFEDLLRAMNPSSTYVATRIDRKVLQRRLHYGGVCRLNTLARFAAISGASTEDDVVDLAACMEANKAVVVVNAPSTPYADVVVMIPKVAVLLVQCKSYGSPSTFKTGVAVAEISDTDVLLRVAKCSAAVPVVVGSKEEMRDGGTCVLWEPAGDVLLVPKSYGPKRELLWEECTARRP